MSLSASRARCGAERESISSVRGLPAARFSPLADQANVSLNPKRDLTISSPNALTNMSHAVHHKHAAVLCAAHSRMSRTSLIMLPFILRVCMAEKNKMTLYCCSSAGVPAGGCRFSS
jgi:hypothetical protein